LSISISHFVEDWVKIGYPAKKKVQIECKALPFDEQCTVLEKVSIVLKLHEVSSDPRQIRLPLAILP
jgi:carbonic anhydrase